MIYQFDTFRVDDVGFRLLAGDVPVAVEPKALRVLLYLVENPNRLVRKQELLDAVWGDASVGESALTRSIGLLRKALEDDSRNPRFIETVPTAGYRFIADVRALEGASGSAKPQAAPAVEQPTAAPLDIAPPATPARRNRMQRWAQVALVAGVVSVLTTAVGWVIERRMHAASRIGSLAVLPLENLSGDPGQEYFADGTTDELITELARVPNLRVVSRTSAMQEKGLHKPLQQIAQELKVDAVVEGSVVRAGDRVRITAQLIDTRDDRHLWAQSFEGPGSDVLALQDQVAREIASHAKLAMLPAESAAAKAVNPAAHDAYLRGKYFLDKRDARKSANYFEQAMAIDPGYALAYSGLAMALQSQTTLQLAAPDDVMPRAIAAAQRAIELDPSDGEAYVALGGIDTTYRWDWADAERNLLRGLELSPNDATAEFHYASYLDAMGRPEDAVTHMRRAVALDPLSFLMNRHLGSTLFFARHYDEALFYLRRAGEMEPARANVVENWISWVYLMKGMQAEAVRHDLASLPGGTAGPRAGQLQQIYAQQGWKAYWEERARGEESSTVPCASYDSAAIDLRLGQTDKAFAGMDKAIDRRCLWSIWLKVDPLADGLRGDKRYGALLARVKLPG